MLTLEYVYMGQKITVYVNEKAEDEAKRSYAVINNLLLFYGKDLEAAKMRAYDFVDKRQKLFGRHNSTRMTDS